MTEGETSVRGVVGGKQFEERVSDFILVSYLRCSVGCLKRHQSPEGEKKHHDLKYQRRNSFDFSPCHPLPAQVEPAFLKPAQLYPGDLCAGFSGRVWPRSATVTRLCACAG